MWVNKRGVCSRRLRLICFTLSTSKYPTVCGEAATVRFVRSRLGARYVSFHGRQRRFRNSGIRKYYYTSMTALVDLDLLPRRAFLSTTFALPSFTSHAQAFGHEPNALPKLCNLLRIKILAPRARFELATLRLTAECSTIELPGKRRTDFFSL